MYEIAPRTLHGRVWAVAFSPDGHTASGSSDQTVRLWDVRHPPQTYKDIWLDYVHCLQPGWSTLASGSGDKPSSCGI